jgi:menaquinone-specific isochorismate synthase
VTLRARTERLDAEVDLAALAGEDGVLFERGATRSGGRAGAQGRGFAGRGVALRIDVPRDPPAAAAKAVHAALDAIAGATAGRGPVAVGALPFALDRPGTLVVPEVLVGRDDVGTRWVTTVLPAGAGPADHDDLVESVVALRDGSGAQATAPPQCYEVRARRSTAEWQAALAAARDELRAGAGRKVVLAREIMVTGDRPLSRAAVARRLRDAYPACTLFAVDGFVGATPELLVARAGDVVRAQPMAGTAARSADPTTDARLAAGLLSSAKDRVEHRFTIDMVHDTLLPYCSYLDEEAEPSVVAMANVQHLATQVEGRLSAPAASVIELMTALHPTPAVGGSPRGAALALIDAHEALDRGRYAGPVGWVDADGNGEWAVGIRSAELAGATARVFAGVGVVADSDPDAELAETRAKLQALLSALVVV